MPPPPATGDQKRPGLDGVKISKVDLQFEVVGRCWASFKKNVRRRAVVLLDKDLTFVDLNCECTEGLNACCHAAGVLYFVSHLFGYLRVRERSGSRTLIASRSSRQLSRDKGDDVSEVPCTSKP